MDMACPWGLREGPFEATLDARFFYPSAAHEEALARLRILAEDGDMGFGLLTGEVGSGKTHVAAVFARTLDPGRFVSLFLPSAGLGFGPLLDQINCMLRGRAPTGRVATPYELRLEFRRLIATRIVAAFRHLVVVIDDAQGLEARDLVELRALSNEAASARSGASRSAVSFVLVGQPELREQVCALPAVETRVGLRYHLTRLGGAEVGPYLAHRLKTAGHPDGRVFTEDAVRLVAELSRGVPREVNRLAKLAMYAAVTAPRPPVRMAGGTPPRAARPWSRPVTEGDVRSVVEDTARQSA